jgi:hypothetical protein
VTAAGRHPLSQSADAIMESMPPVPWTELATKSDLRDLDARLGSRIDGLEYRFGALEAGLKERFDVLETGLTTRFDVLETGLDNRFEAFEGRVELLLAQNLRMMMFFVALMMSGVIGTIVGLANFG